MLCTTVVQIYSPDPVALSEFSSYGYFVVWVPVKWESFIHSVYTVSVTLFSPHILINGRLPLECNLREMESRRPTRCRAFLLLRAILSPPFSRLWVLRWRVHVVYTRRSDQCKRFYLSFHDFQSTCRFAPFTHRNFPFSFILLAAPLSAPCPFLSRHRRSSLSRLLPKITRSFHSPLRSRRVATRFSPALRSYWLLCCVNSALRNEISNSRHRFQPTRFSLFYFCFFFHLAAFSSPSAVLYPVSLLHSQLSPRCVKTFAMSNISATINHKTLRYTTLFEESRVHDALLIFFTLATLHDATRRELLRDSTCTPRRLQRVTNRTYVLTTRFRRDAPRQRVPASFQPIPVNKLLIRRR